MAITATDIKDRYQEFSSLSDAFIAEKIAKAELSVDETVLDAQYDDAVEWYACHLLAQSPFGQQMQLVDNDGEDIYYKEWERIAVRHGRAYRTLGA